MIFFTVLLTLSSAAYESTISALDVFPEINLQPGEDPTNWPFAAHNKISDSFSLSTTSPIHLSIPVGETFRLFIRDPLPEQDAIFFMKNDFGDTINKILIRRHGEESFVHANGAAFKNELKKVNLQSATSLIDFFTKQKTINLTEGFATLVR